jgi:hypothetical protein
VINRPSARRRVRRTGVLLALPVLALSALAGASSAQASPYEPDPTPQRGTGTLTDPWVPMLSARTTCSSTTLFRNYSPGTGHQDVVAVLPAGTWMGVRYIVSGGYSANVLWHNHDVWGFMRDDCLSY